MKTKNTSKFIVYALNIMISILILGPILYTLGVSFMTPEQIFEYPPRFIPRSLYIKNYKEALEIAPIGRFIFNSFIMSVAITAGQIITGMLAAYAFSFMEFKGKKILFIVILSTLMIPGQAVIIANYLTISSLGLLDTFRALILPYLTSALGIFLFRQFFLSIPKELYEAAVIDGCGNFRFLISIVIPLSKPAIGSLGIYTFLHAWNMYMWPLLTTNRDGMRTVQIGISMLENVDSQAFGPVMAGIIMIILPSIIAFILGQKQLIEGLTAGSVKS
ncbi:carbohydrate ABC transporter permease [Clostridium brassicae]|uniref:Carbohydrate ABC transporter permease n=1 Tax=Clostridium brassicae TaxID=2999072 RepID=A0ABT4D688_9CLOT|nr:carbohydrate ABC transporter permease [Clostridium brassicae]MCY6957698.1 carbohydrate ABC transporter permease [Clostridium brassicae]